MYKCTNILYTISYARDDIASEGNAWSNKGGKWVALRREQPYGQNLHEIYRAVVNFLELSPGWNDFHQKCTG